MSCPISIQLNNAKALSALKDYCGNNTVQFTSYFDKVVAGVNPDGTLIPTSAFKIWYEKRYKNQIDFNSGKGVQLRDRIVRYIKESMATASKSGRVNKTTQSLAIYGYPTASARVAAKKTVVNLFLDFYAQQNYDGIRISAKRREAENKLTPEQIAVARYQLRQKVQQNIDKVGVNTFYFTQVKNRLGTILAERIAARTGEAINVVKERINKEGRSYTDEALGGKTISLQDATLAAVVYEFTTNPNEFIKELLLDNRLSSFKHNAKNEFNDENERYAMDAISALEEENNPEDENPSNEETDNSVALFDHSGTFTNAMMHIDTDLKIYFNSLKKLNSGEKVNGEPDYDTNNEIGIADTMNANECASVLYHHNNWMNVDEMIAGVKQIANTIPGFAAFHSFYEDLVNNPSFAYQVYRTFSKPVITKIQTIVENGQGSYRHSNQRSDVNTVFRLDCLNDIKSTAINVSTDYATEELKKLAGLINLPKKVIEDRNSNSRKKIVTALTELYRTYYPTITESTIENYISSKKDNGVVDAAKNIGKLKSLIEQTIKATKDTRAEYDRRRTLMKEAFAHNRALREEADAMGMPVDVKKLADTTEMWDTPYISTSQTNAAMEVANELVDYALVRVDSNSVNVNGNQSSDVINDNLLTAFRKILKNPVALERYGAYKMLSNQYKYGNILLEHRDENGNIINQGLFRYDEKGNLVPTGYAKDLLEIALYDGARNYDEANTIDYRKMGLMDYTATNWIHFFGSENRKIANYFMRIPSDAPRTYTISAPRYDIHRLFTLTNKEEVNNTKKSRAERIKKRVLLDTDVAAARNKRAINVNIEDLVKHWNDADGTLVINIPPYTRQNNEYHDGETVTLKFHYNPKYEKDNTDNIYTVTGTYEDGYLVNGTFNGIYNGSYSQEVRNALNEEADKYIEKQGIGKYSVDKNHPIFKQLKNIFRQELLDAAIAIDKFFVTDDNGVVQRYKDDVTAKEHNAKAGEIIWKDGMTNNGKANLDSYDNYHHDKKTGEIVHTENGRDTLVGNVFHSDRFKISEEDTKQVINYGEQAIEEAFDFLYGGASNKYLHVVKDVNGNVSDVVLTEEQEAAVDKMLESFINEQVAYATRMFWDKEEAIHNQPINHENVADYVLNYHLAYNMFNELFEGDTKFYKDSQDLLKRAKEYQGSGTIYGIADFLASLSDTRQEVGRVTVGTTTVPLFNKFRAITVLNTEKSSKAIKAIREKLKKATKLTDEKIDELLHEYEHKSTKVNDAQSYISYNEFKRRITARGQLGKYKTLFDKIDRGEKLVGDELVAFIQVQKNFYYDLQLDNSGLFVPMQIKNAEFVLIPQLVEGTELEQVANLMDKYGIDQINTVETVKAAKANALELFDAKTGMLKEDIIDELNGGKELSEFGKQVTSRVYLCNYSRLYTQQETPQHIAAENKIGIQVIKKLFDNIPKKHKLYPLKEQFFKLYSTKIERSYNRLMTDLNVELNDDGTVKLEETLNGNTVIKNLDFAKFYEMLEDEIARLGYNSNMLDYVTPDPAQPNGDGSSTIMPNYVSFVSQKAENLAQSVFTNRVTKQKLPGFHAAQISNVGFRPLRDIGNGIKRAATDESLHYHYSEVNGVYTEYAEIKLPASAFKFKRTKEDGTYKTDEELLKELQDAGLDKVIGYRIPTEGKQSVCVMKIVGFVNDAYGSTIVVPDEWVTQTGSDFDIDSVYGIQSNTYIDKSGHIQPVKYKKDFTRNDWFRYISKNVDTDYIVLTNKDYDDIKKESKNETKDEIKDKIKKAREALDYSEKEVYNALDKDTKTAIILFHKQIKSNLKGTKKDIYIATLQNEIELLNKRIKQLADDYSKEELDNIQAYIDIDNIILNNVLNPESNSDLYNSTKSEKIKNKIENFYKALESYYSAIANDNGLLSEEEYLKKAPVNPEEYNSTTAIDNEIVDILLKVLSDDTSIEENLSRSNFDDVTGARDEIFKAVAPKDRQVKENRSAYSVLDQAKYQQDATAGIALKGFSVARDTFCSVCNTVQPYITDANTLSVLYSTDVISYEEAVRRFGERNVEKVGNKIKIKHNKFGWSFDDKNVVGKILTSYSSQTTAHILDIIKEGAMPNVNQYTFGVYKLFPDLGSDYSTCLAFMMQNGVSRIVRAYEASNSIYVENKDNPITGAIKEIAKELGIYNVDYSSLADILKKIDKKYGKRFGQIHNGAKISLDGSKFDIALDYEQLLDELSHPRKEKGTNGITDQALYDLGIVLQFYKLNNLASKVSNFASVTNPDKFGAKQTIFATNKVFDDIYDIVSDEAEHPTFCLDDLDKKDVTPVTGFLQSIYPGISKGLDAYLADTTPITKSTYATLNAFLKYSTAISVKVNRSLFLTQTPEFRHAVMRLSRYFTGDKTLTEKQYKDFEKYIIGHLYNNCASIMRPITYLVNEDMGFASIAEDGETALSTEDIYDEEKARIFGYGVEPVVDFRVEDMLEPTQEEVNAFTKLSPAQKVAWIQSNLQDTGIFKYIRANMFYDKVSGGKNIGRHTLEFVDDTINIEDAYVLFEEAFSNTNPFVALAAYDVIKYAFVVEGYKMQKHGVSACIPNSVLYNDFGVYGTGIISELNTQMKNINEVFAVTGDKIYQDYIRSHDIPNIPSVKVRKPNRAYELVKNNQGIIRVSKANQDIANRYKLNYAIGQGEYAPNHYVKLRFDNVETLYKIVEDYGNYYLYPINNLEQNEHSTFSANPQYQAHAREEYYYGIISEYIDQQNETFDADKFKEIAAKYNIKNYKAKDYRTAKENKNAIDFDLDNPADNMIGSVDKLKKDVQEHFGTNGNMTPIIVLNKGLSNNIKSSGAQYGLTKTFILNENTENEQLIKLNIYRLSPDVISKSIKPYLGSHKYDQIKDKHKPYTDIIEKLRSLNIENPAYSELYCIEPATTVVEEQESTPNSDTVEEQESAPKFDTDKGEAFASSITEVASQSYNALQFAVAKGNNELAKEIYKQFTDRGIYNDAKQIGDNLSTVILGTSEYVIKTYERLDNGFKYFIPNPDGDGYLSIIDDGVLDIIRHDKKLRDKYLRLMLDAECLVRNYSPINELNIDSQTPELKNALNKMKECINKLRENYMVKIGKELFATDYLNKLSTDPLVQREIIDILNGSTFARTSWFTSWVGGMEETTSPLIQVILKEVLGDIRGREAEATQKVRALRAFMNDVRRRAAANGKTIDFNNIIDEYGRFVTKYNQQFTEDKDRLQDAVSVAKAKFGEGSLEHLKAKLEYDKWKVGHVNREISDDYYIRRIEIEEKILNEFSIIYTEYKKLQAKRRDILSHITNGVLEKAYQDELDKVQRQIYNLTGSAYYDETSGTYISKQDGEGLFGLGSALPGGRSNIYSIESVWAINEYIKAMAELNDEFFESTNVFGFDENLERNLHIVNSYEARDAKGNISIPLNLLMENEEYVRAKSWIAANAYFVVSPEDDDFYSKLQDAYKALGSKHNRDVLNAIVKREDAKDEFGHIIGTKLSDTDIQHIKEEQQRQYDFKEDAPYSDRRLISNSPTNGVIYTSEFYERMTGDGITNPKWTKRIHEINEVLAPYYDSITKKIRFDLIPNTDEGIEVYHKLALLYSKLQADTEIDGKGRLKRKIYNSNGAEIKAFIEKYVDYVVDEAEFAKQEGLAKAKGELYFEAWQQANLEIDFDDNLVPNHFIYGYPKPKPGYEERFTDKKKTEAIKFLNDTYTTTPTQYYYQKTEEMKKLGKDAYEKWWQDNHIYNPYTQSFEPIRCWTQQEFRDTVATHGKWVPRAHNTERNIRADKKNSAWNGENNYASNYKEGSGYDNANMHTANAFELEVMNEFKRIMTELVQTDKGKSQLLKGFMPSMYKAEEVNAKFVAKELLRTFGLVEGKSGDANFREDMDYSTDVVGSMPMLSMLDQKTLKEADLQEPKQSADESDEDFAKRVDEYKEKVAKLKADNLEAHKNAITHDWEQVMENFILNASHFNAIEANKSMLYYGRSMIQNTGVLQREHGFFGELKQEQQFNENDEPKYSKKVDTNLLSQYDTYIRRLINEQWKQNNGGLTKAMSKIQAYTSANYMMLNVRGGIANVTLGRTQIIAEEFAKEYLGHGDFWKGASIWAQGVPSYLAHLYDDKSTTVADAVIKYMKVIDEDISRQGNTIGESPTSKTFKAINDFAYSTLSSGEHYMQNSVLFAMMQSHRLYEEVDDTTGERQLVFKNEAEAVRDADIQALKEVLTSDQLVRFNEFIAEIKRDDNLLKDYVWRSKDIVNQFVKQYVKDKAQVEQYIAKRKELENTAKQEFYNNESHPTLYSQMKLGDDQMLSFTEDGLLSKYDIAKADGSPSDAHRLLGDFRGRVISVNRKIHGIYDRLNQGQIEKTWIGSLIMQYHKHIYPGILKRFRKEGMYNEQRGTIEKGSYVSLIEFLKTPIDEWKRKGALNDGEATALTGIQNLFKEIIDFVTNAGTHWALLPDYEKANIRRNLGDLYGVSMALFATMLLKLGWDDDDEEDNILYNLALYEADRLASESFQFNPLGMISEAKKLWSTPIAAQSGFEDLIQSISLISKMLIEGDEFDPYYHTGQYAGEHKLSVYVQRRIPIWRNIKSGFIDINDSNKYYKMGDNMLGIIPVNRIVDWIKE